MQRQTFVNNSPTCCPLADLGVAVSDSQACAATVDVIVRAQKKKQSVRVVIEKPSGCLERSSFG